MTNRRSRKIEMDRLIEFIACDKTNFSFYAKGT